jgi:hypothetical protein
MKTPKNNGNGAQPLLTDSIAPATVGFRLLNEADRRELARRALKAGTTPHDVARAYVIDALHSKEEIPQIQEALVSLYAQITELRRDLALSVEMILLSLEKDSKKDIQEWVKRNLHRE